MGQPITNITIVGGGTAGWITAAYLNQRLQWGPTANRDVNITLIESPDIPTIGVGEATVPTLKHTMKLLSISEAEFMARTDATFKLGIWFQGWNLDQEGNEVGYLHPFTGGLTVRGHNPAYSFKKFGLPGANDVADQEFVRVISAALEGVEANRGPRALNGPAFGGALQYAYHIDAGKLAEFLQEICVQRGVRHMRDDVIDANLDDRGYISSLQLKRHGEWPVELVIDCTGFKGMFINEKLGEPFDSYEEYLFNDRAIPIQVKHKDPMHIPSATTSTALSAGWCWNIPLRNRVGTGYVFCSKFKSDDEALAEFDQHLNGAEKLTDPRVLKFKVGRMRRSWVKNCIAMGLSSGFVEPLESTAIMSVELQARWLLASLTTLDFEEPLIEQFNSASTRLYDEIRDFLSIHFYLARRKEPYWQAVEHESKISDSLKHHLELWKYSMPSPVDPRMRTVFGHWSVISVLMGKNFFRDAKLAGEEVVSRQIWDRYWRELGINKRRIVSRLAGHRDLVEHMVKQAVAGTSATGAEGDEKLIGDGNLIVNPQQIMAQRAAA